MYGSRSLLLSSYSALALLNMLLLLTQKFWLKASTRSRCSRKARSSADSLLGTGYLTGRRFDTGCGLPTRNLSVFCAGSRLSLSLLLVGDSVVADFDVLAEVAKRLQDLAVDSDDLYIEDKEVGARVSRC